MSHIIRVIDVTAQGHVVRLSTGKVVTVPHGRHHELSVGDEWPPVWKSARRLRETIGRLVEAHGRPVRIMTDDELKRESIKSRILRAPAYENFRITEDPMTAAFLAVSAKEGHRLMSSPTGVPPALKQLNSKAWESANVLSQRIHDYKAAHPEE